MKVSISYPLSGITVRQSPVWASHTRICPARQQLASSMPSLARHSISCEEVSKLLYIHQSAYLSSNNGKFQQDSYHAVTSQQQRRDFTDRRGVTVFIAGQIPTATPAVGHPVLPVVSRTEHSIQTEKQKDQHHTSEKSKGRHPAHIITSDVIHD